MLALAGSKFSALNKVYDYLETPKGDITFFEIAKAQEKQELLSNKLDIRWYSTDHFTADFLKEIPLSDCHDPIGGFDSN